MQMDDNERRKSALKFVDIQDCYSILLLGAVIALLSLIVPVSIQMLVNFIAFGKLLQPVVVISLLVFLVLGLAGILSIWQFSLLEAVQQKIMVMVSVELGQKFLELSPSVFSNHRGPELVNRFFEVSTFKKTYSKLLLYGTNLILQVFFSLILLLFYHPYLFLFDLFVVIGVALTILLPYKKALSSAVDECFEKHTIAAWLEEILLNKILFKLERYPRFVLKKLDECLVRFLHFRNIHFDQQVKHLAGFYLLGAVGSSLLLGLGSYLVIINQLSLGQLVASEVVFGYLVYALKEAGPLLEEYYDFRAATGKLNEILSLPSEYPSLDQDFPVDIQNVCLTVQPSPYPDKQNLITKPFVIEAGKICTVFTSNPDVCIELSNLLLGLDSTINAEIYVNDILANQKVFFKLRQITSYVGEPSWFFGTIAENLTLQAKDVSFEDIFTLLKTFGLEHKVALQTHGIDTHVHDLSTLFTDVEQILLSVVRAILAKPKLIVVNRVLDQIPVNQAKMALNALEKSHASVVLISQSQEIASQARQLVRMDS